MKNRVIYVALALVRRAGCWLVALRRPDAHLGGFWEFPGGKIEPGESAEAAAIRELWEECRVSAAPRARLPSLSAAYEDRVVVLTPIVCDWLAGEGEPAGCVETRWLRVAELAALDMPTVNLSIIQQLQE